MKIGCLALQGCVDRHRPHVEAAGAEFFAVKTTKEFDQVDAFILPGGESTTMLRLIKIFGLWDALEMNFASKPVWGICAGTILMAEKAIVNDNLSSRKGAGEQNELQKSFGLLPMSVLRNGYGTQLESRIEYVEEYPVSFIRAPVIQGVSNAVDVLEADNNGPIWVQGKGKLIKYMATTFHPELTFDFPSPMHQKFVDLVKAL